MFVCVRMCVGVHTYVCVGLCVCTHECVFACVRFCMCTHVRLYVCLCVCVRTHMCVFVCVCVRNCLFGLLKSAFSLRSRSVIVLKVLEEIKKGRTLHDFNDN